MLSYRSICVNVLMMKLERESTSKLLWRRRTAKNRIRATGRDVVRWDWADLTAGKLEGMLAAAGVPRRRTRSATFDTQTQP
jgi:hypothetical protein